MISRRLSLFVALTLLVLASLGLGWKIYQGQPSRRILRSIMDLSAKGRVPGDPYIGSRVCRDCHANEYALYTRSGHSLTLTSAASHPVARILDKRSVQDPEIPGMTWTYALRGDTLQVERKTRNRVESMVLDYAIGSSRHATTFLTMIDTEKQTAIEHRISYFGPQDRLDITTGQEHTKEQAPGTTSRGRWLTPRITLLCFRCHATQTSAVATRLLDENTMIPNVSCELCHGPGRDHVSAALRGEEQLTMPLGLEQWTPRSLMRLCGDCHRHPDDSPPGSLDPNDKTLARFQPIGIIQSKCFKESGGALSCVDCHDPHARPSSDRDAYETTCLRCHSSAPRAVCPKSPSRGCIQCHMPQVGDGRKARFTDHWIRVR